MDLPLVWPWRIFVLLVPTLRRHLSGCDFVEIREFRTPIHGSGMLLIENLFEVIFNNDVFFQMIIIVWYFSDIIDSEKVPITS